MMLKTCPTCGDRVVVDDDFDEKYVLTCVEENHACYPRIKTNASGQSDRNVG